MGNKKIFLQRENRQVHEERISRKIIAHRTMPLQLTPLGNKKKNWKAKKVPYPQGQVCALRAP